MPVALIFTIIAVFGTVALTTGAIATRMFSATSPGRRRLTKARRTSATGVVLDAPTLSPEESKIVKRLTSLVPRSPKEMASLRRQFVRAGYYNLLPVAVYVVAQLACALAGGLAPLSFGPPSKVWIFMLLGVLVGYQIPGVWLYFRTVKRQKAIENGLPDMLDLLIVCLEAGSAMDQAIVKVSDELELSYPELAQEFRVLVSETRAGKPRMEAFRNLASRTGVDDIRALVAMLVQTDRFGTSVTQALRTHADVSRTKRRQRAEERAAKIGVKLVFPLVFMLFPAFFVVTLGPAVIKFIQVFFSQMGQ